MNSFKFSDRSLIALIELHPHLQRVFTAGLRLSEVDFGIMYPVRTIDEQKRMVDSGFSTTFKSRHIRRLKDIHGVHAGDVYAWVDGAVSWDMTHYRKIARAMFKAAIDERKQIEWGGLWSSQDGPHFQLSWASYP